MGSRKRRKKNNRRRKQLFHAQVVDRLIHDDSKYDKHKEFLKEVERKEIEELNRTIFITNVNDLRKKSNLRKLREFFESTYGPVERCCTSFYGKRHDEDSMPTSGKIIFKSASSATNVFGKPLDEIRSSRKKMKLIEAADIAYHGRYNAGFLKVFPAQKTSPKRVPVQEENEDPLAKEFTASFVSLGHWIPEDHGFFFVNGSPDLTHGAEKYEFIEEFSGFEECEIKLDLRQRLLQIIKFDIPKEEIDDDLSTDELLQLLDAEINNPSADADYYTITFQFKSVQTYFDLGYDIEDSCYSILFSCKEPPKIHGVCLSYDS